MSGRCPNCSNRISYIQALFKGREIECVHCGYALEKRAPMWILIPCVWGIMAAFGAQSYQTPQPWVLSLAVILAAGFALRRFSRVTYPT